MPTHAEPSAGAGAAAASGASGFELRDVLRVVYERKLIIIGGAVLGLVLGIIVSLMMTPLYRATAMLELDSEANQIIDQARGDKMQMVRAQDMIGTTVGLLQSEALAKRVAENLNLAAVPEFGGEGGTREQRTQRAAAVVQGGTSVEPVRNSLLLQVSHSTTDPQLAARVANGIAEGYIASSLERRYDSSSFARKFLSDQLARTKVALEDSERKLNAYATQANLFKMPGQVVNGVRNEGSTLAAGELAAMHAALNEARVRRISAEQAYLNAPTQSLVNEATETALEQELATARAEYEQKAKIFKPAYPQMQQLAERIRGLDEGIRSSRGRAASSKRSGLQGEYMAAARSEAQLGARVAAAQREVQDEGGRSIEYNILQREADTNRALYDALLQRYKDIGVAGGVGKSNVALVDRAKPPSGPYRPNLMVNSATGMLLGAALSVALAFAVHLLFDNIVTAADVRQKLRLPVLGVVPMEQERRSLMEALGDRKSDVAEAYYSVRTALKFSRPEGAPETLLITSTRPGEGKSTSAYAIASSMARLGGRVLLVDADLRKPTFVSSREDGYGLAHLLGTEEPLAGYVEPTQVENLDLLPVGRFVGSAAELLSSSRLPAIIAEARSRYDMVVLDGPPVLGLTDAPLLGSVAEGTAIVVESRESRTSSVADMVRRLVDSGSKVIGVILTKVPRSGIGYGYDYYNYSYGDAGGRVSSEQDRAFNLGRTDA